VELPFRLVNADETLDAFAQHCLAPTSWDSSALILGSLNRRRCHLARV
jgi:hypothetical protein